MPPIYKIIAGTSEAGGAECLLPVITDLQQKGHRVVTIAGVNANNVFYNRGYTPDSVTNAKNCLELSKEIMRRNQPDIVITGLLGSKDNVDYSLIRLAKELQIPVLSILDSWMNYADRVFDPVKNELLGFLPDKIALMDEIALREMSAEGIPEKSCVITGHPKFDLLPDITKRRENQSLRANLLNKYRINGDNFVGAFFSHPVKRYYPNKHLGYDEDDVFPILFSAFKKFQRQIPTTFIFKEHPRGKTFKKEKLPVNFIYADNTDADELTMMMNCAISMSSTVLVFAAAMGIPVISIQPNLKKGQDLNVLTRSGYCRPLSSADDIYGQLLAALELQKNGKTAPIPSWLKPDGKSCERIEKVIHSLIRCQIPAKNMRE